MLFVHHWHLEQGLAAGLMMSISFFDLFPESVEAVGEVAATIWFFIGAAFFAVIVTFIPEPDSSSMVLDVADDDEGPDMGANLKHSSTGTSSDAEPHPSTAVRRSSRARRWASKLSTYAGYRTNVGSVLLTVVSWGALQAQHQVRGRGCTGGSGRDSSHQ
jgi:hypothetical protein